ncbi:MAG TPA: S41 family peptidase [Blastocatellia bacterium]|nr:S41 family peptidase [Blastocatellia bacterium]
MKLSETKRGKLLSVVLLVLIFFMLSQWTVADGRGQATSTDAYSPRQLTAEQAMQDVEILRKALQQVHPGLTRYTSQEKISAAIETLVSSSARQTTDLELYANISLMLAEIRCDHTKAEEPEAFQAFRKANPSYLPFRFRLIDGRMFVSVSDPEQKKIERGTEVLKINGTDVSKIIAVLSAAISVDGFTDHAKMEKLTWELDEYYSAFFGVPSKFVLQLREPKKAGTLTLTLLPVNKERWRTLEPLINNLSDPRAVKYEQLDAKTAYLNVATFINYRTPVNPTKLFRPIFEKINSNGTEHLIVDLRSNGGGSDEVGIALARFLMNQPFALLKSVQVKTIRFGELTKYLQSWDKSVFNMPISKFTRLDNGVFEMKESFERFNPEKDAFRGRITVLIGAGNASGVTMLLAKMKDAGRIRLVGDATGGSAEGPTAGILFFLKLPNSGITVRVPWKRQYMDIAKFEPGKGLLPDVLVKETIEDFLSDVDRTLKSARMNF